MRILILGGDGFIGSHLLTAHVQEQNETFIVDVNNLRTKTNHDEYDYIYKDLNINTYEQTKLLVRELKPDLVYNCVAIANPDFYVKFPIQTFELDFTVNYNIIQALIHCKVAFVHFSTSEVYGKKWTETYNEDTTDLILGPTQKTRWVYATSKILLEQLILAHNTDCCIIRPQNFCGWDLDWLPDIANNGNKKWIPRFPACVLNSLYTNKSINIVLPGSQTRCYTHIDDAIKALISIEKNWSKCRNQVINIGNPRNEISIEQFALKMIQEWNTVVDPQHRFNKQLNYIPGEKLYGEGYEDCERRFFSTSKIHNLTKWYPEIDINETVTKIITDAITNIPLS